MPRWFFYFLMLVLPVTLGWPAAAALYAQEQPKPVISNIKPQPEPSRPSGNVRPDRPGQNRPGRPDPGYQPGRPPHPGPGRPPGQPGLRPPNRPGAGVYPGERPGYPSNIYRPGYPSNSHRPGWSNRPYYDPDCGPYCGGGVIWYDPNTYREEVVVEESPPPAPAVPERGFSPGGFERFDPYPEEGYYIPPDRLVSPTPSEADRYRQMMRTWQ